MVLKNGDRLTGTAVKLADGKLTFKTPYTDAIAIAWNQVASLTTSQPLVLPTAKGNLSVSSIERTEAGMVVSTATGVVTLEPTTVAILELPGRSEGL